MRPRCGEKTFDDEVVDDFGSMPGSGAVEAEEFEEVVGVVGKRGIEPIESVEQKGKMIRTVQGLLDEQPKRFLELLTGFLCSKYKLVNLFR